jgi:hypothetical protein
MKMKLAASNSVPSPRRNAAFGTEMALFLSDHRQRGIG